MLSDYLKNYEKRIIKRLFPNKIIDWVDRCDENGYSHIFLEDNNETPIPPHESVYMCYNKITEEQRNKLISNKPEYVTVEEFDPPIYKRYVNKVYKITTNPSLEQRIERCQQILEKRENSTNELDKELCEVARERLQELLELQTSLTV